MNYFEKLPTITYNNNLVKNLLARAKLSDSIRKQKSNFYPYTMDSVDRIDNLANLYYDQPGYTWLIWLTNNTIDPYFDLPLSEEDLFQHIKSKYGSFDIAARKIKLYRSNWYDNTDDTLSVQQFDALNPSFKKYYQPVLDNGLRINNYKRKRQDDTVSTNKIISANITAVQGTFVVDEEIRTGVQDFAFSTHISASAITMQHVTGTISGTITGQVSGATATVSSVTTLVQTVAVTDSPFWSPVTFLDFEQELNEAKKIIRLLDVRFTGQADSDLRRVMQTR